MLKKNVVQQITFILTYPQSKFLKPGIITVWQIESRNLVFVNIMYIVVLQESSISGKSEALQTSNKIMSVSQGLSQPCKRNQDSQMELQN